MTIQAHILNIPPVDNPIRGPVLRDRQLLITAITVSQDIGMLSSPFILVARLVSDTDGSADVTIYY